MSIVRRLSYFDRGETAARLEGTVTAIAGGTIHVTGLSRLLGVGDRLSLIGRAGHATRAEIIGFRGEVAQALPFGPLDGVGPGSRAVLPLIGPPARAFGQGATLTPHHSWIGRVLDPCGVPLDGKGSVRRGPARALRALPANAVSRGRLGPPLSLGVRAMDAFTTCRQGQRLGLFAGSGVGKSTLMAMLARHAVCDVVVLALVGERGREVREFLEDVLGPDGRARAVTIVATSDASPLARRDAALAAMTVAEFFRDSGNSVLLLMDSVTRFCLSLREIALAAGELPATRGYPPGVFAELPRLLERAGPGPEGTGHITALFTVLVEGDDMNEPVADAARGILDGHIVLDRRIAEAGRYPAIDVLRSLSRTVPGCLTPDQAALALRARAELALHAEMADMVRLGAYRPGTDPAVDQALRLAPRLLKILAQDQDEPSDIPAAFAALSAALAPEPGARDNAS